MDILDYATQQYKQPTTLVYVSSTGKQYSHKGIMRMPHDGFICIEVHPYLGSNIIYEIAQSRVISIDGHIFKNTHPTLSSF